MIRTLKKPPGAYPVGYRKPPARSRFTPGRSGNPRGRPRGSKSRRPALNEERLKGILMDEAYRTIAVNDPNGALRMPMAQAVVRSIALNAAKGNPRAQRLFTELLRSSELEDRRLHDEWLGGAIEYKMSWEHELEERKRLGTDGPEPLPHPDDIVIDRKAGTIRIKGPMTKEEKVIWDRWRERKKECDLEIAELKSLIRKAPEGPYRQVLLQELEREKKIKEQISRVIPD